MLRRWPDLFTPPIITIVFKSVGRRQNGEVWLWYGHYYMEKILTSGTLSYSKNIIHNGLNQATITPLAWHYIIPPITHKALNQTANTHLAISIIEQNTHLTFYLKVKHSKVLVLKSLSCSKISHLTLYYTAEYLQQNTHIALNQTAEYSPDTQS